MMNYEYNGRKSGGGFNECVALGKTDRDHAFQVRAFWESRINDLTVQSRQSQNQDGLPAFAHIIPRTMHYFNTKKNVTSAILYSKEKFKYHK